MGKSTPRRDVSAKEPAVSKVIVMNLYRTQPLSFHFRGGSARLGPLEKRELDRRVLSSPELAQLISIGAARVIEPPAPPPARAAIERETAPRRDVSDVSSDAEE